MRSSCTTPKKQGSKIDKFDNRIQTDVSNRSIWNKTIQRKISKRWKRWKMWKTWKRWNKQKRREFRLVDHLISLQRIYMRRIRACNHMICRFQTLLVWTKNLIQIWSKLTCRFQIQPALSLNLLKVWSSTSAVDTRWMRMLLQTEKMVQSYALTCWKQTLTWIWSP